jgi:glucuronokinase
MNSIASLADEGLSLAQGRPYGAAGGVAAAEAVAAEWAALFARNFNGRRALFGDAALGRDNIRMVEIARECGASAKFPGSGGAVVGVVDVAGMAGAGKVAGGGTREARIAEAVAVLRAAYHAEGYVFIQLQPHETRG